VCSVMGDPQNSSRVILVSLRFPSIWRMRSTSHRVVDFVISSLFLIDFCSKSKGSSAR